MKLQTKFLVFGALLPTLALAIAAVVGGVLLQRALLADIDAHLRAQATLETNSMFDGHDGTPHVHPPTSRLPVSMQGTTAHAAIYDGQGVRLTMFPTDAPAPATWHTGEYGVRSVALEGLAHRQLTVQVLDDNQVPYTLWLALPMAPVQAAMKQFVRSIGASLLGLGALLFLVQWVVAARLRRRIATIVQAVPSLGTEAWQLASQPTHDELATLAEALRTAHRQLTAAKENQDRFLSSAAHELRTPVAIIKTEAELALRRPRSADELAATLANIEHQASRVGNLATQLLDREAAQRVTVELRRAAVDKLVGEAVMSFAARADAKNVQLGYLPPSAPAMALVDEVVLRQAVDNVLDNAIKYAPEGGQVAVALGRDGDALTIAIRDDGPGIPPAQREAVFLPFVRAPGTSATQGAGLGLAIVREAMTRLGGTVQLVDAAVGCNVELRLPSAK